MKDEDDVLSELGGCALGCFCLVVGTISALAIFAVALKLLVMAVRWACA